MQGAETVVDQCGDRRRGGSANARRFSRAKGRFAQGLGHCRLSDPSWQCRRNGCTHTTANEPLSEPVTGTSQTALNGAQGAAKLAGRFGVRPALQVAEHDDIAIARREPAHLLVDQPPELVSFSLEPGVRRRILERFKNPMVVIFLPLGLASNSKGDTASDPMKPGPEPAGITDRTRPASQNHE